MDNTTLERSGVMRRSYDAPTPVDIQVSVLVRDELGFPIDRRELRTKIPGNVDNRVALAERIGEAAEKTARLFMGMSVSEEEGK